MSLMSRIPRPSGARGARYAGLAITALAFALGACADSPTGPRDEQARLTVSAAVAGTPIATIVITVSAADIAKPLVFNLTVSNGTATGTLRVPPGAARLFTAQGFDATGEITHEGAATADVKKGDNPPLAIAMLPRTGHVPITITIGSVNVAVNPASAVLTVGATQQLAAAITYESGHAVPGAAPGWASSNPAVASVDQNGLVTAHAVGEAHIMAVFAGSGGASAVTVSAAPDPSTAKIAFASTRDGNWEIYVMNQDAGGQTRLTNTPGYEDDPAWSPDRTQIAFASSRDGYLHIFVMNADGSGQTRLTNNSNQDMQPSWSPDGARIAFTSIRDGSSDIYVMNADGTGQTPLTTSAVDHEPAGAVDYEPAWSPDGRRIAFVSNRGGTDEIYVMNADGTGQTRLTNAQSPAYDSKPAWSPDGTRIAFASSRDGDMAIYVMNADGSGETHLTNEASWKSEPAWSPDGRRIAFTSGGDGNFDIYVMNADGTGVRRLTVNTVIDRNPAWR